MIYGINIDDIWNVDSTTKMAIKALPFRATARVVIDNAIPIERYIVPVTKLHQVCDVMIQVQDSYGEAKVSFEQYTYKCERLMEVFGSIASVFEIGNEINGDWLSKDIWQKVQRCLVMAQDRKLKTAVTLFMDAGVEEFVNVHYGGNFDYVFLSCYPVSITHAEVLANEVPKLFGKIRVNDQIGIGEYGTENFRFVSPRDKSKLIELFDRFNGGFYWDFQRDCVPQTKSGFQSLKRAWLAKR